MHDADHTIKKIAFIGILLCFITILIHLFEYISINDSYYDSYESIAYDDFLISKIEDVISECENSQIAISEIKSCQKNQLHYSKSTIRMMRHKKNIILFFTTLWILSFIIFCYIFTKAKSLKT